MACYGRAVRCSHVLVVLVLAACSKDDGPATKEKPAEGDGRKLAGVFPDRFKCESIASVEALGQVLGGAPHQLDSALSVPKGLPRPCNYEVLVQNTPEYWTFDIDCRDTYKQQADRLFAQYKDDSAAMVHQYDAVADAGIKPTDAGVVIKRPGDAVEVQVGAKGLDHHGQGLIFVDDDAPCYVRITGPDAARRLELAKLLAKNLTFANAPMTPRAMP